MCISIFSVHPEIMSSIMNMDRLFFLRETDDSVEDIDNEARAYFMNPNVTPISVRELNAERVFGHRLPDWRYISATILNIKRCLVDKEYSIKAYKKTGKTKPTIMFLLKENYDQGKTFYLFLDQKIYDDSTIHMYNHTWRGLSILLLNPSLHGEYKENFVLALTKPHFPTERLPPNFALNNTRKKTTHVSDNLPAQVANQIHGIR